MFKATNTAIVRVYQLMCDNFNMIGKWTEFNY
jgi:hypothetical protein